jgi:DNA integrity scanning protein DisA with diadenylate cyclase activity
MPSPFPGMDPYLETPDLWPDVHSNLIIGCQGLLNHAIGRNYVARVELRVYISNDEDPARPVIPDARIETAKRNGRKPARSTGNGTAALAIAEPLIVPITLDEEIEEARIEIKHRKTGALVTVIEIMSPSNKIAGSEGRESFMKKRRETLVTPAK